jgi:hypothetical protein
MPELPHGRIASPSCEERTLMSISSIGNPSSLSLAQLYGVSSPSTIMSTVRDASTTGTQPTGASRFAAAIKDAFASVGVSLDGTTGTSASAATSSSTAASSTTATADSGDAINAFVQSLLAALHGQAAAATTTATSTSATTDASSTLQVAQPGATAAQASAEPVKAHHGHGGHGHHGKLEGDLQSLISELTSSTDPTTDPTSIATDPTATASTSTASTSTAGTPLSALQQSFNAVLAQSGVSPSAGGNALTTFLESLASRLHGAPATGNVVSTAA